MVQRKKKENRLSRQLKIAAINLAKKIDSFINKPNYNPFAGNNYLVEREKRNKRRKDY